MSYVNTSKEFNKKTILIIQGFKSDYLKKAFPVTFTRFFSFIASSVSIYDIRVYYGNLNDKTLYCILNALSYFSILFMCKVL